MSSAFGPVEIGLIVLVLIIAALVVYGIFLIIRARKKHIKRN